MSSWHSYGKIFTLGHRAIRDLFTVEVLIEEKVDGSQFSFGMIDGVLKCKSHHKDQDLDAPDSIFKPAIETVKELAPMLMPGWTYRGETLAKPKHNTKAYSMVPPKNIIIFDIARDEEDYLSYDEKVAEAARLGLIVVPRIFQGKVTSSDALKELLKRESVLGGTLIEGIVIKGYGLFGEDKKTLMGKLVSEEFKEEHKTQWGEQNVSKGNVIENLIKQFKTVPRWQKAVQHLREAGKLEDSPRDIEALLKEIKSDVETECGEKIKEVLFKWAWKDLSRALCAGFPEWYKAQLLARQFEYISKERSEASEEETSCAPGTSTSPPA